ncbi:MAG: TonB-dependent receptor [Bacteroidota bacterium]
MKKITVFIFSCLIWAQSFAQDSRINGKVVTSKNNEPVAYAAILLTQEADSTNRTGALTNTKGEFDLKAPPAGKYLLKISFLGFKSIVKNVTVSSGTMDLGIFSLEEDALSLKEVVVTGEQVAVKVKKDTIEYNADSFKTQPNAVVEELLKKLPGVEVDRDGNILVQGQKVTRLTVDGKDFFGTDPKTATKNLPADAIAKIQVVDSKTQEAKATGIDDGQREKVLNLTIKEDKKRGWFGNANASGGTTDRYNGYLSANHFNKNLQFAVLGMSNNISNSSYQYDDLNSFSGGNVGNIFSPPAGGNFSINVNNGRTTISGSGVFDNTAIGEVTTNSGGVNYSNSWGKNNKLAISSSYFTNFSQGIGDRLSNIQDINQTDVLRTAEQTNRNSDNEAHRFNLRAEYKPDSLTDIVLRPNVILNFTRNIYNRSFNSAFDGTGKSNDGTQFFDQKNVTPSLFGEFSVLRRIKKGSVALRLNGTQNTYNADWINRSTINTYPNGAPEITRLDQQAGQDNDSKTYTLGLTYNRQLNKLWSANAGYNYNRGMIDAQQLTYDYNTITGRYETLVPNLSNRLDNINWMQSARFGFINTRTQWTYNFGFWLQESGLDVSAFNSAGSNINQLGKVYYNFLPRLNISFKNKANHTIQLNYNSSINLPSANDLQPVQNNTNPLYQRIGNPELEARKNHRMAINFNTFSADNNKYWNGYFLVNYAMDDFGNSVLYQNGVQNVKPVNVDGNYYITTGTYFGRPSGVKNLRMGYGLNFFTSHTSSFINSLSNITDRYNVGPNASVNYDIDGKLNAGFYMGVQYSIVNNSQPAAIDNNYFNFYNNTSLSWEFIKNMRITSDLQYNGTAGRADGFNNNMFLLNAGLEQYMMKRRITLSIKGFDILNQNTNIDRTINASRIEDIRFNSMTRYFYMMLNFRINKAGPAQGRSNPRSTVG